MGKRVKMPGRVESAEMGGIVTGAGEILDDLKGKTQEVINTETDAELLRLDQTKQVNLTFDQTPTESSMNPVTSGGVYAADQLLSQAIEAILLLIPSAASALNKLVDMNTMNSSISTATASFKGTYNLVSDLHLGVDATHAQIEAALDALSLNADNNDYAFVQVPNSGTAPTEIKKTERYKFNGTNWAYEYDLNNSGFTAAQWAAINSNITAVLVSKLSALPTNEALIALLAAKQDVLTFDDSPTSGSNNPVKSGGIYTRNNEIIAMITALDAAKQDVLTFDTTPTENSTNPVTSNGVYQAIYLVQAALAALDGRMLIAEHSIEVLTDDVGVLRTLYQALSQSDIIVGGLPVTGVANTVYRVPGTSTYADWMYYDGAWVKLAEYTTLDGYLYKGIATPSSSPAASADKMFYFALTAGTYTNFGNIIVTEGISILKYDGANWSQDKISYMDGGVFDVTAYSGSSFASLDAILSDANLNNLIPSAVRKGGMSIKFVHTPDHKYVQYRLMDDNWSTAVSDWQGVDEEPVAGSENLVESGGLYKQTFGLNGKTIKGIYCDFYDDFKAGDTFAVLTKTTNRAVIYGFRQDGTYTTVLSLLLPGCTYFYHIDEEFKYLRVTSGDSTLETTLWHSNKQLSVTENGEKALAIHNRYVKEYNYNSLPNGYIFDERVLLRKGDTIKLNSNTSNHGTVVFSLLKKSTSIGGSGTYVTVYASDVANMKDFKYIVPSDEYSYIRLSTTAEITQPVGFTIEVTSCDISSVEDKITIQKFSATGMTGVGIVYEKKISINKGESIVFNLSASNVTLCTAYFIKTESIYQNIYYGNPSIEPVSNRYSVAANDNYTSVRLFVNQETDPYNIDFDFFVVQPPIRELSNRIDSMDFPSSSDLRMCLPNKVFAVKGLPYNIYKSSIMYSPDVKIDMFTYPIGTQNIGADLIQIGEACRLDNLKNTTLRIGLRDYLDMEHRIIHKDLPVVWNDIASPITKLVNIIGDSITNRGAGAFAVRAANLVGCTITGFGTMNNYLNFKGEGREGWTWGNFIGESNSCGSGTITPQGEGTSGSLITNPFIREATAADLSNYPQWCFPSTGAVHEMPYSEDTSASGYYIFDYSHYLTRWNNQNIPEVVTIALGTNDRSLYTDEEICANARWMVSRIRSAVPSVKIGIIPPGPMAAANNIYSVRYFSIAEALKSEFANDENVNIIGLWCFMSRFFSFGLTTNTVINPSTDNSVLINDVHFDGGDASDKRSYVEYGRVLASFILTQ